MSRAGETSYEPPVASISKFLEVNSFDLKGLAYQIFSSYFFPGRIKLVNSSSGLELLWRYVL